MSLEKHALVGRQLTAFGLILTEAGQTRCPGGLHVIGGESCHGPLHGLVVAHGLHLELPQAHGHHGPRPPVWRLWINGWAMR